jgi:hypothetical protein
MNLNEATLDLTDSLEEILLNQPLLDQLIGFLTSDDWSFTRLQGEPILYTTVKGNHGEWNCFAQIREEQNQILFYSICPTPVPEDKRSPIAEFLTRANSGLILGNFELDFDDGEIRYKTSIDVTNDFLNQALIKQLVYTNVSMMDEYLPGIQAVIAGEATPIEAIRRVEMPDIAKTSKEAIAKGEEIIQIMPGDRIRKAGMIVIPASLHRAVEQTAVHHHRSSI